MWLEGQLEQERVAIENMLRLRHADLLNTIRLQAGQPRLPTQNAQLGKGCGPTPEPTASPSVAIASDMVDMSAASADEEGKHEKLAHTSLPTPDSESCEVEEGLDPPTREGRISAQLTGLAPPVVFKVQDLLFRHGHASQSNLDLGSSDSKCQPRLPGGLPTWKEVQSAATGSNAELCIGIVVILNTITMATQRQYEGFDNEYMLNYEGAKPADMVWPGWAVFFNFSEHVFGSMFLVECVLKLVVLNRHFCTMWNCFDFVVVLVWCFDRTVTMVVLPNPTILRTARIARILRLVRVVHWAKCFDSLHVLMKCIQASLGVLVWSLLLLFVLTIVITMMISQLLQGFIGGERNDLATRRLIFGRWGNLSRSLVTMFEIIFANWGPPCWELMNHVDEWWGVFVLVYKMTCGFAVVQVIISVFIQQTFKVASRNEELMIREKDAASAAYIKSLDRLFDELDESGDGYITMDEFSNVMSSSRIQSWFTAMDVDVSDLKALFEMMDDGDGQIGREEFIDSVKKIHGGSKTIDMIALLQETRKLAKSVMWIKDTLGQRLNSSSDLVFILTPSSAEPQATVAVLQVFLLFSCAAGAAYFRSEFAQPMPFYGHSRKACFLFLPISNGLCMAMLT